VRRAHRAASADARAARRCHVARYRKPGSSSRVAVHRSVLALVLPAGRPHRLLLASHLCPERGPIWVVVSCTRHDAPSRAVCLSSGGCRSCRPKGADSCRPERSLGRLRGARSRSTRGVDAPQRSPGAVQRALDVTSNGAAHPAPIGMIRPRASR
jgi:hypothetical protein